MSKTWSEILIDDHQTTERVFDAVLQAFATPAGPPLRLVLKFRSYVREYVDGCHNKKEEDHLFPLAEARGVPRQGGPLAVMLMEHEQSRQALELVTQLVDRYSAGEAGVLEELREAIEGYASLLKGHFWKETDVLYPMVRRLMEPGDDAQVLAGIEATEAALGPDTRAKYYGLAKEICGMVGLDPLSFALAPDVLAAILDTLPVELSFVDAEDTVRYFSHEHHDKIFPRTRGSIGVKVQQCHPAKSVHLVNRILADFKAGKKRVAEFWIDLGGRRVHIRYFAVRNPQGQYLGCLEVVQDITAIQALTGERRLLD
ncbi:MAG: DUF438 domain-containing protein [Polyangiaceae bacterium]|nr:DUF438 domain-containing protein [Polyangiaceae bacterium]